MKIDTKIFGRLSGKEEAYLFTIQNSNGIIIKMTSYGGTVISILAPDRNGQFDDIVLGFDSLEGYLEQHPYIGTLVGRYANRIAGGRFYIGDQEYRLAQNEGQNHLHGGLKGYDKILWDFNEYADQQRAGVMLSYRSFDMEEGYPGNLKLEVNFSLNDNNELTIEYTASTNANTHLNLTHHGYYNLNGGKDLIYDHELFINASSYVETDKDLIPTGELILLKGGAVDFRTMKPIGRDISKLENGYDHCYVLNKKAEGPELAARVNHPASGRIMEVYTTEPAIQFYSSNFLEGLKGKNNIEYRKHLAFCLEAQHYPDSPNHPHFPSTLLKPGDIYKQTTIYKLLAE